MLFKRDVELIVKLSFFCCIYESRTYYVLSTMLDILDLIILRAWLYVSVLSPFTDEEDEAQKG